MVYLGFGGLCVNGVLVYQIGDILWGDYIEEFFCCWQVVVVNVQQQFVCDV